MVKKILITVIVLGVVVGSIWALNVTCPVCDGSRTQTCSTCYGDGYYTHPNDDRFIVGCSDCGGRGTKHVRNGIEQNYREGRGVVACGACDGKGYQSVPDSDE